MRRLILLAAALAVALPSLGHASTTIKPPWRVGSSNQGVDTSDQYMIDGASGQMTVFRLGGAVNGSLGCAGIGPFANFEFDYAGTDVVKLVSVHYENAIVDPYTWLHIGVKQGDHYVDSFDPRGPFLGSGDLTISLAPGGAIPHDVTGPFTVEFGLNVASACPSVDGGTLQFTQATVS